MEKLILILKKWTSNR